MRDFINRENDLKEQLPLQIFVGFGRTESVAYHACYQSILENSSRSVSCTPIGIDNGLGVVAYSRIVDDLLGRLVVPNELYGHPC